MKILENMFAIYENKLIWQICQKMLKTILFIELNFAVCLRGNDS